MIDRSDAPCAERDGAWPPDISKRAVKSALPRRAQQRHQLVGQWDRVSLAALAAALKGDVRRGEVLAPGPGHSAVDRSLSVRPTHDRLMIHSFSGDDWRSCRDHVLRRAEHLLTESGGAPFEMPDPAPRDDTRTFAALRIWESSDPIAGTPAQAYLKGRGLDFLDANGTVLRWNTRCPFGGVEHGCLVALIRDVTTDEPIGIQRTALSESGVKLPNAGGNGRLSLGKTAGGAIKLITSSLPTPTLGIAEGVETALSIWRLQPGSDLSIWAVLSAGQMRSFPVLDGYAGLLVGVDNDAAGIGAADAVSARWHAAHRQVSHIIPNRLNQDLNDVKG